MEATVHDGGDGVASQRVEVRRGLRAVDGAIRGLLVRCGHSNPDSRQRSGVTLGGEREPRARLDPGLGGAAVDAPLVDPPTMLEGEGYVSGGRRYHHALHVAEYAVDAARSPELLHRDERVGQARRHAHVLEQQAVQPPCLGASVEREVAYLRAVMHKVVDAADGVVARAKVDEIFSMAVHVPRAAAVDDELQSYALSSHVDLGRRSCLPPLRDV
jgi:hypothetical protein